MGLRLRPLVPPGAGGPQRPHTITPDGRFVLYTHSQRATSNDILMAPLEGSARIVPVVQTAADEGQPHVSADGVWLALPIEHGAEGAGLARRA